MEVLEVSVLFEGSKIGVRPTPEFFADATNQQPGRGPTKAEPGSGQDLMAGGTEL